MSKTRKMRLVAFLKTGPTAHHHGMWRHPETDNDFLDPAWYEHVARVLEKGRFDCLFFADTLGIFGRAASTTICPAALCASRKPFGASASRRRSARLNAARPSIRIGSASTLNLPSSSPAHAAAPSGRGTPPTA